MAVKKTARTKLYEARDYYKSYESLVKGVGKKELYNWGFAMARAYNDRQKNRNSKKLSPSQIGTAIANASGYKDFDKLVKKLDKGYTVKEKPKTVRKYYASEIIGSTQEAFRKDFLSRLPKLPSGEFTEDAEKIIRDFYYAYNKYSKKAEKQGKSVIGLEDYISNLGYNLAKVEKETLRLKRINQSNLKTVEINGAVVYESDVKLGLEIGKKRKENIRNEIINDIIENAPYNSIYRDKDAVEELKNKPIEELIKMYKGYVKANGNYMLMNKYDLYPDTEEKLIDRMRKYDNQDLGKIINTGISELDKDRYKLSVYKGNYYLALNQMFGSNDERTSEIVAIFDKLIKNGWAKRIYQNNILNLDKWYDDEVEEARKNEIYEEFKNLEEELNKELESVKEQLKEVDLFMEEI